MKKNAWTDFINDYKIFINDVKKSKNKIKMVIPNILTFSRVLAPFFILPATLFGSFTLAFSLVIVFALTDAFDGFLARRWNVISEFGKNLDPISDKFFTIAIIIPFITNPQMILTLILEGIIGIVNVKSAFKNNKPKSTYLGKGKTVLLSLLITLSYLYKTIGLSFDLLLPLIIFTNTIQAVTAIDYMHIDNKKDIVKEVENIINENNNNEVQENSKRKQEILELKNLKNSLTNVEKEEQKIKRFKL